MKFVEVRGNETITYECYQTNDVNWYFEKKKWTGLKTFGMVKKSFDNPYNQEKSTEYRYYISSLDTNLNLFYKCTRCHWLVEKNKLYWYLDFTFKQCYIFFKECYKQLKLEFRSRKKSNYPIILI